MEFPSIINKEDIKDYKFVFREKGSGTRNIVETQLKNANIKIIPDIEISSSKAIISLVANSDYIGFVSKLIAEDLLKRGIIKEVKIDSLRIERKFTCIMQKNTRLPKIERDFLNFLLKESEIL
jgi:DNA-binding transcriptional LysR family regulator